MQKVFFFLFFLFVWSEESKSESKIEFLLGNIENLNKKVDSLDKRIQILENANNDNKAQNPTKTVITNVDCETGISTYSKYIIQQLSSGFNPESFSCLQHKGSVGLVLMKRFNGKINFDKTFKEYEDGFGQLQGEYWIGLKAMHELTKDPSKYKLLMMFKDWKGNTWSAEYSLFTVRQGPTYKMYVRGYTGSIASRGGLEFNSGKEFSTKDHLNGLKRICPVLMHGGWWSCGRVSTTGKYFSKNKKSSRGMFWRTAKVTGTYEYYNFASVSMSLFPQK